MKMITLLLCIAGFLPFTACSDESAPETPIIDMPTDTIPTKDTTMTNPQPDTIYYLALGDSYTIGESVKTEERYPVQLAAKLRKEGVPIADPKIIARTGWTTRQLKQAIESESATLREEYDLVSLLIGVNNQYQGVNIDIYKTEFRELLKKAIELAGGNNRHVFVISIPDYAYTPFGRNSSTISRQIDEYNAINLSITTEYNVSYYDITPISRKGLAQPDLVASDGLHPSGKMYEQWVELIFPDILSKVK